MHHITHKPLHAFFRLNMVAGLLVLAAALLPSMGVNVPTALEAIPADGAQLRVAFAALLYTLFASYADLYFRPRPNREM